MALLVLPSPVIGRLSRDYMRVSPPGGKRPYRCAIVGARCASFAIRSSFVQTVSEPNVSIVVPFNGSMTRCLRPSTGFLGKVPPLPRYNEAL
jgi:hypothetical protein